jgi:hypothetical protein
MPRADERHAMLEKQEEVIQAANARLIRWQQATGAGAGTARGACSAWRSKWYRLNAQVVDRLAAFDPFLDPLWLTATAGPLLASFVRVTITHGDSCAFRTATGDGHQFFQWHADALGDRQDLIACFLHFLDFTRFHFLLDLFLQVTQITYRMQIQQLLANGEYSPNVAIYYIKNTRSVFLA